MTRNVLRFGRQTVTTTPTAINTGLVPSGERILRIILRPVTSTDAISVQDDTNAVAVPIGTELAMDWDGHHCPTASLPLVSVAADTKVLALYFVCHRPY